MNHKKSFSKDKIYQLLLLLISLGIGLQIVLYKVAFIALLLFWILDGNILHKIKYSFYNKKLFLLILIYIYYAISIIWTENYDFALDDLILKSPLLFLPLIFSTLKTINHSIFYKVLLVFAFSSLFINFYCLISSAINYSQKLGINSFYYHNLTINMHSAYQSMYACFSIVILYYLRKIFFKEYNLVFILIVFCQLIFILLLASRMQIIIIMLLAITYLCILYYKQKKIIQSLLYIGFLFFVISLFVSIPSSLNYRYNETIRQIKSFKLKNEDSDARHAIWKHGMDVIQENILVGAGIGDAKDELNDRFLQVASKDIKNEKVIMDKKAQITSNRVAKEYLQKMSILNKTTYENYLNTYTNQQLKIENKKYKEFVKRKYNFHNQYLQTGATIGVIGLTLLLILLGSSFYSSIKDKQFFLAVFIFLISASFLTESMLERQAGVSFFAFFYSLLFSQKIINKPS